MLSAENFTQSVEHLEKIYHLFYCIRPNYRIYPYKPTVKQFHIGFISDQVYTACHSYHMF